MNLSLPLPIPGPLWGRYPRRPTTGAASWRPVQLWSTPLGALRSVVCDVAAQAENWAQLDDAAQADALQDLRRQLRRDGLRGPALTRALAATSAAATRTLGLTARDNQLLAAAALLNDHLAEMATGEGKTLATALAAAVAALAGLPVHVVTANAYLAARDAHRLEPLFHALGLGVACAATGDEAQRRIAYLHDVTYATAKDLAFDFLRDQQDGVLDDGRASLSAPRLRGLCIALVDEADSVLLDDAEVPLILSRAAPHAARRAFLWQALALARQLRPGIDVELHRSERRATLTPAGEAHASDLVKDLEGPWQRARLRREALHSALTALHALERDTHYVVREGRVELLDDVTARVAEGRVLSRGLHTLVALKEGVAPPPETETVAQTTYQRFFQRYWRLAGLSGTLWEARSELEQVYGTRVVRIPLHRPCRRAVLPARSGIAMDTVVARIRDLSGASRPVLVGVDSIDGANALSQALTLAGVAHNVLHALNDADESRVVARAGCAGQVTVATRMAGRGTDIEIDDKARAAGGLHVLNLQRNPSRRHDRQLAGRAARHGDPGTVETWILSTPADSVPHITFTEEDPPWNSTSSRSWHNALAMLRLRVQQRREELRRQGLRKRLFEEDLEWEKRLAFAGPSR
jgi:preprotein translocase subunit SecA